MVKTADHINNWSFGEQNESRKAAKRALAVAKKQDAGKTPVRIDSNTIIYK